MKCAQWLLIITLASISLHAAPPTKRLKNTTKKAAPPAVTRPIEYVQAEVGPHSRTWVTKTDGARQGYDRTTLMQIESGMNYFDGQKWVPSKPIFEPDGDAFVADRLHY